MTVMIDYLHSSDRQSAVPQLPAPSTVTFDIAISSPDLRFHAISGPSHCSAQSYLSVPFAAVCPVLAAMLPEYSQRSEQRDSHRHHRAYRCGLAHAKPSQLSQERQFCHNSGIPQAGIQRIHNRVAATGTEENAILPPALPSRESKMSYQPGCGGDSLYRLRNAKPERDNCARGSRPLLCTAEASCGCMSRIRTSERQAVRSTAATDALPRQSPSKGDESSLSPHACAARLWCRRCRSRDCWISTCILSSDNIAGLKYSPRSSSLWPDTQ